MTNFPPTVFIGRFDEVLTNTNTINVLPRFGAWPSTLGFLLGFAPTSTRIPCGDVKLKTAKGQSC